MFEVSEKRMQRFILILAVILALIISGCSAPNRTPEQPKAEYVRITPQEAQDMMSEDVIILDVRTPQEFDEVHIINAVLLPLSEIREKAGTVITDKSQTILVYCRTGRRSETAAKELIELGYMNVFDFGGIVDWTGDVLRNGNTTSQ